MIRDKKPLSFVDRDGFRDFLKREFPGYIVPDRHTITEIADECTDQSRDRVIELLKEHIANHGTVCAAHDKWTKKRRSFLGSAMYWVSRPQWKLHTAISACACLPVGKSARIPDLRNKLDEGYKKLQVPKTRLFGEVSDQGSDLAGAVAQGGAIKAPCGAHVQQCTIKDIYINDIKEPKLKHDGLSYKANSGTRWPNGTLLSKRQICTKFEKNW